MMKPPIEPSQEDCCNSGCSPCIFDVYQSQLDLYNKSLRTGKCLDLKSQNAISQLQYTDFSVTNRIVLTKDHVLLSFKLTKECTVPVWWKPGQHFLVKYSKDKTFTRAYTPVKLKGNEDCDFVIILKKYDEGIVSNYLCSLNVNDNCLWRGPYGAYERDNKYCRLIMIAQGTGLAPFLSIIDHVLNNEDDMTRIVLLYCCRSHSILLRNELYDYKSLWNFSYKIFLDDCDINFTLKYEEPIVSTKLNAKNVELLKPFSDKDQFLLCGSPLFIEHFDNVIKNICDTDKCNIVLF